MADEYQPPKAIVETDEGYWHDREVIPNPKDKPTSGGRWQAADDNRIPPVDLMKTDEYDERESAANQSQHDTKIIMAHELRENPEGFKAMAEKIADSYNETHTLKVGEALPEQLERKEKKDD